MLEGDELFEYSADTAYKICCSLKADPAFVPWNRVFSAHWDPTDSDRIALCSQNGQIRMVHRSSGDEKTFVVKFRRYLASAHSDNSDAKTINYHFDKTCLLPNRPGEFLFLLGVSKSIMYSALPGYCTGDLSHSCRPNSHSYGNGCPVFQVLTHTSRITAMAVSGTGHILSSGDEQGNLKVVNIFQFRADKSVNSSFGTQNEAASKIKEPIYTEQLSASFKAHSASVYAVHWLPQTYGHKKQRVSCLVTGSDDRVVKLWRVQTTVEKMVVQPLLLLSTMASSVLSLNSCFISPLFTIDNAETRSGGNVKSKDMIYERKGAVTVLSAGTSTGAVYVWKIFAEDIFSDRQEPMEASSAIAPEDARLHTKLDDGSRLVSIIFAADKPVIHVSPAVSPAAGLVLAMSDISGTVKFHKELTDMEEGSAVEDDLLSSVEDIARVKIRPMVFVGGEKHFSSPVVSCMYRRPSEEEIGFDYPERIHADPSTLLMCESQGNFFVESTEYTGDSHDAFADTNTGLVSNAGTALEEYFRSVTEQMVRICLISTINYIFVHPSLSPYTGQQIS
jgi:WD40 repeat protein